MTSYVVIDYQQHAVVVRVMHKYSSTLIVVSDVVDGSTLLDLKEQPPS